MTKFDWDRVRKEAQTRRYHTDRDVLFRADGKAMLISVVPAEAGHSKDRALKATPKREKATQPLRGKRKLKKITMQNILLVVRPSAGKGLGHGKRRGLSVGQEA